MNYTLTQKELTQLRTKLTKAVRSMDNKKIVETCDAAFAIFEAKGYPDNWSNWDRAKEDARFDERTKEDRRMFGRRY